jgi:hypothetical protein
MSTEPDEVKIIMNKSLVATKALRQTTRDSLLLIDLLHRKLPSLFLLASPIANAVSSIHLHGWS